MTTEELKKHRNAAVFLGEPGEQVARDYLNQIERLQAERDDARKKASMLARGLVKALGGTLTYRDVGACLDALLVCAWQVPESWETYALLSEDSGEESK